MSTHTATHLSAEQLAACQRLHDQLVASGPEHFDMGTWLEVGIAEYMLVEAEQFGPEVLQDCGTRACIAGHAALAFTDDELTAAADRLPSRLKRFVDVSTDDPAQARWHWQFIEEEVMAELLGMNVWVPQERHTSRDWFGSDWPVYAQQIQQAHYLRSQSAWGENYEMHQHIARADHATVVQVLDEIIHGVRRHWWDGDILTADELASLDDVVEDSYVELDEDDRW